MEKAGRMAMGAMVETTEARCPPADDPMMPMSLGLTCQTRALSCAIFMAAKASLIGMRRLPLGMRYLSTPTAMPRLLK